MFICNNVVYANSYNKNNLKIIDIKIISELCMLVTFSNKEKRIFDLKNLTKYPIYKKLEDFNIFKNAYIENGIIVWDNGSIDIGIETVYNNSYSYDTDTIITANT